MSEPWADSGNCIGVDPELFFPQQGGDTRAARAVCRECDVRAECLAWALRTNQKHGVWGGMTEAQRRILRRHERQVAVQPRVRHLHLVPS